VSVIAAGFSTALRTNVTLTVGAQQVLDFTMQVGQVSQNVEVTEEAPSIDLASSTISGVSISDQLSDCLSTADPGAIWRRFSPEFRVSKPCRTSPTLIESVAVWEIN